MPQDERSREQRELLLFCLFKNTVARCHGFSRHNETEKNIAQMLSWVLKIKKKKKKNKKPVYSTPLRFKIADMFLMSDMIRLTKLHSC